MLVGLNAAVLASTLWLCWARVDAPFAAGGMQPIGMQLSRCVRWFSLILLANCPAY